MMPKKEVFVAIETLSFDFELHSRSFVSRSLDDTFYLPESHPGLTYDFTARL